MNCSGPRERLLLHSKSQVSKKKSEKCQKKILRMNVWKSSSLGNHVNSNFIVTRPVNF